MPIMDLFKRKAAPAPKPVDSPNREPVVAGPTRPARDLPVSSNLLWDSVGIVTGALQGLEQGNFAQAALMLDAMMGDSHIAAKLDDRLGGLLGAPFSMKPPPGLEEDAAALEIAEDAEEAWPGIVADSADRAIARDGIMLGVGLGEVVVDPSDDGWRVHLKHWHMRNVRWTWNPNTASGYGGAYWVTTTRGIEEIKPDGVGGYFSTWKDATGIDQVSRWLLYTPYGYQRGWVNGRIKAIATAWLLRRWAFRDWGRHSEVLGIPPKKVKVPVEWDQETKERALRELTMLASEGSILCPQKADGTGFDVELLELKGPSAKDTFDGLIERAESSITVALVGQTLTTQMGHSGGSRAAGQVHERVEDKIRRNDAKSVGRAVRACVLQPWTEWNYGDPEMAPVPTWDVEPAADLKSQGDGLKALGDGMKSLMDLGVPVDRAKVVGDAGIPLEAGGVFEDPKPDPVPPAPGQMPGQPTDDGAEPTEGDTEALSRGVRLSRRTRAPIQGQVYADELADSARDEAARLLAGDRRAVLAVLSDLKPTKEGGIPVDALREKLLKAYKGMDHSTLARMTEKVLILAELSGRYAVQKEV